MCNCCQNALFTCEFLLILEIGGDARRWPIGEERLLITVEYKMLAQLKLNEKY